MQRARISTAVHLGLACLVSQAACTAVHTARPLGKDNTALQLSVGGPVAGIGSPQMWVPLTTVTVKHGLTDRVDLYGGWHLLETFLNNGNLFFDLGASAYLVAQKGYLPGLSVALTMSPLVNRQSGWLMFDAQVTASWYVDAAERQLIYGGAHNGFTPVSQRAIETPRYSLVPYVGWRGRLMAGRELEVSGEIKWYRPYQNTHDSVIGFISPAEQGALGFFVAIGYSWQDSESEAAP